MEKQIATFKDYAIFMADKTSLLEIAQFVVKENYSHHLSSFTEKEVNEDIKSVLEEEEYLYDNKSHIYIARDAFGNIIGCIRSFHWDKHKTLPIEKIYGCHLLNEKSNCSLGNIASANLYTDMKKFKYAISHVNKENQDCVNCWCRNLCGGCTVECFYDEKKGCFTNRPQKEFCEFRQEYIKKILTLLVAIRTDEPLWRLLINSLNGKEL